MRSNRGKRSSLRSKCTILEASSNKVTKLYENCFTILSIEQGITLIVVLVIQSPGSSCLLIIVLLTYSRFVIWVPQTGHA